MRAKRQESLLTALIDAPWWASVALAGTLYVALAVVLPYFFQCDAPCAPADQVIANLAANLAPFALVFLVPAPLSALRAWKERRRLDRVRGLESILPLDWRQFESLVAEIYRGEGLRVDQNRDDGPDGGVDLRCRGSEGLFLVQCKHWRRRPVGVSVVRELYGVMAAEGAYGGAVVTSGSFTEEAKAFAKGLPVELIDGMGLQRMLADAQRRADPA